MRNYSSSRRVGVIVIGCLVFMTAAYAQMTGGPRPGTPLFPGHEGLELDRNLVIPQIAVGQHYTTSLVLLNLGHRQQMGWVSAPNLQTRGRVHLFGQDGGRLAGSVNGSAPVSQFSFVLEPEGIAHFDLASSSADTSGWALIEVEENENTSSWGMRDGQEMRRGERIMATVFYTYQDDGRTLSRAGVFPSVYEMGRFLTSVTAVQIDNNLSTGVAMVNTGSRSASVELRLKNAVGLTVGLRTLSLPPGNQVARFVEELFPELLPPRFQGVLEVLTSEEGVVTMGMLVSAGVLTSIPTMHYGQVTNWMPR